MSWGIPSAAAHESSPLPQTPETIAQGRRIYQRCCINCHGECGLVGRSILDHGEGGLFYKIYNGKRPMPGFKNHLSRNEIWQVVAYLKAQ